MAKVALLAKMTAKEGEGGTLIDVFKDMLPSVEAETGTEIYAIHADASNPDVVWFYELYTGSEALTVHSGSEAMKALGPKLGPLMAGRPELIMLTPVVAKGLEL